MARRPIRSPTGFAHTAAYGNCQALSALKTYSETSGQILLAEIGTDMRQSPTAGQLLSWAGLVPRLDESAGRRRLERIKQGSALAEAGPCEMRSRSSKQKMAMSLILPGATKSC